MKYKSFICLQPDLIIDTDKWSYTWKEFLGFNSVLHPRYVLCVRKHRVPFFLSPYAHIVIEQKLEFIFGAIFQQFICRGTCLIYDILHGILCAYGAREIMDFWRSRD